jgi:hypothetical protein
MSTKWVPLKKDEVVEPSTKRKISNDYARMEINRDWAEQTI